MARFTISGQNLKWCQIYLSFSNIISEDIRLHAHWQIWLLTADEMKRPIAYLVATANNLLLTLNANNSNMSGTTHWHACRHRDSFSIVCPPIYDTDGFNSLDSSNVETRPYLPDNCQEGLPDYFLTSTCVCERFQKYCFSFLLFISEVAFCIKCCLQTSNWHRQGESESLFVLRGDNEMRCIL